MFIIDYAVIENEHTYIYRMGELCVTIYNSSHSFSYYFKAELT